MLDIIGPIELNEHVVLAWLQVFILFPNITIHALFTVLVDERLLFGIGIVDFGNDQAHIAIIIVNMTIEAPIICLIDGKVVMATSCDLEANQGE